MLEYILCFALAFWVANIILMVLGKTSKKGPFQPLQKREGQSPLETPGLPERGQKWGFERQQSFPEKSERRVGDLIRGLVLLESENSFATIGEQSNRLYIEVKGLKPENTFSHHLKDIEKLGWQWIPYTLSWRLYFDSQ